jgi:hypothetical protein
MQVSDAFPTVGHGITPKSACPTGFPNAVWRLLPPPRWPLRPKIATAGTCAPCLYGIASVSAWMLAARDGFAARAGERLTISSVASRSAEWPSIRTSIRGSRRKRLCPPSRHAQRGLLSRAMPTEASKSPSVCRNASSYIMPESAHCRRGNRVDKQRSRQASSRVWCKKI